MSKELDKFKKSAKPLLKNVGEIIDEFASHGTNREHHKQILLECAKEIGRRAAELKKAGQSGTTIDDFIKDGEIKQVAKTSNSAIDSLFKENDRLKKILAKAKDTNTKLSALKDEVKKEIASRKKKKDRKLLAVDSKSLPEMEALCATIVEKFQDVRDEVIMMAKNDAWTPRTETKNFDNWTKQEIAKSGAARENRDNVELGARGFDVRVIKNKAATCKKLFSVLKTACADGLKALKSGDSGGLRKKDTEARKCLSEMKKILKPYDAKFASMGQGAMAGLKQSKDGKLVLSAVEEMRKQTNEGETLIRKVARVTV